MSEQISPLIGEPFSSHNDHIWLEKLKANPLAHGMRRRFLVVAHESDLWMTNTQSSVLSPGFVLSPQSLINTDYFHPAQNFGQFNPSAIDAGFDRAFGDLQPVHDFLVGQLVNVTHDDALA